MKKNHVLTGIFLLSLLANAFFIGLITGHGSRPGFGLPPHSRSPFMRIQEAARDLPENQRVIVDQIVTAQGVHGPEDMKPLFKQLHSVLTASTFDRAALEKLHAQIAKEDQAMKSSMEGLIIALAEKLTPEARVQLFGKMFEDHPLRFFRKAPGHATELPPPPVE